MQVNVTPDGRLQLVDDTTVYPPLTVEAVALLANAIPTAQTVLAQIPVADALSRISDVMATTGATTTVFIQEGAIFVQIDNAGYVALAAAFGANPLGTSFTAGPVNATNTGY